MWKQAICNATTAILQVRENQDKQNNLFFCQKKKNSSHNKSKMLRAYKIVQSFTQQHVLHTWGLSLSFSLRFFFFLNYYYPPLR